MPDFDFETAKRALDEVPAPDLWAEAERRAEGASVMVLTVDSAPRHRVRWLAAAAVAVLAVGTIGVLTADDDQGLDTANRRESGVPPVTVGQSGTCGFGVSLLPDTVVEGGQIALRPGSAQPPLFDGSGQPATQAVAHADLGGQIAEFHVPGLVVTDLVGERVEDVELMRGTADVWFGPDFVQVRWFSGGQETCDSFTVTVAEGTEDANRQAAVDLAEGMVLDSEMEGPSLRQTEWQLERSTVEGVPTDGNGSTFEFRQNDVHWTDGCNEFSATFDQSWPSVLDLLGAVESTKLQCPTNPTTRAISSVMQADPDRQAPHTSPTSFTIRVTYDGDLLILSAGNAVLTLRPVES